MSLYKRGKTWHTDFMVNGERFRQSLDTTDWREAQSKQNELIAQASVGKLAPANKQFSKLNITDAIERCLEDRAAQETNPEANARNPTMPSLFGTTSVPSDCSH